MICSVKKWFVQLKKWSVQFKKVICPVKKVISSVKKVIWNFYEKYLNLGSGNPLKPTVPDMLGLNPDQILFCQIRLHEGLEVCVFLRIHDAHIRWWFKSYVAGYQYQIGMLIALGLPGISVQVQDLSTRVRCSHSPLLVNHSFVFWNLKMWSVSFSRVWLFLYGNYFYLNSNWNFKIDWNWYQFKNMGNGDKVSVGISFIGI